jgi:hypothetical protein
MTARIITFPRPPVRALMVEQLNETQWHGYVHPPLGPKALVFGVGSLTAVADQADAAARSRGIPVMVKWLTRPLLTLNQARRHVPLHRSDDA